MNNYYGVSTVHPVGFFILIVLSLLILAAPKRMISISYIILIMYVSSAQRIVIASADFTYIRILTIIAILRFVLKNEFKGYTPSRIDLLILFWGVMSVTMYTIQVGSFGGTLNRLGSLLDTLGVYFVFRNAFRCKGDIKAFIQDFFILSVPVFFFFIVEKVTQHNIFSVFGGVPLITMIREGRLRVQGAFSHPILAGCFWASFTPFILFKIETEKHLKLQYSLLLIMYILMIFLTASSTPVVGLIVSLSVFYFYNKLKYIKQVLAILIIGIIALDIAMEAPIWHLMTRIDFTGGSTGWHRYYIIEQFLSNFSEWALFGIENIDSWNIHANDITNQYILEAIRGGLITLIAYSSIIVYTLYVVVKNVIFLEKSGKKNDSLFLWTIGSSVFVHVINYFGVSYFGQIVSAYFIVLSMVGSVIVCKEEYENT